jgi:glucosamine--fructose-6-phosphate aminotransferase (isomerizing)
LLGLEASYARGTIDAKKMERQLAELWEIPPMIERQLDGWRELTERLAARYSSAKTLLYLGRGIHYAIAREGALKLKESSYMHAEGFPADDQLAEAGQRFRPVVYNRVEERRGQPQAGD